MVECGDSYDAPTVWVHDFCEGAMDDLTVSGSEVLPSVPGTYTVIYTAADRAGNTAAEEWVVVVEDTQPPEITLNGHAGG